MSESLGAKIVTVSFPSGRDGIADKVFAKIGYTITEYKDVANNPFAGKNRGIQVIELTQPDLPCTPGILDVWRDRCRVILGIMHGLREKNLQQAIVDVPRDIKIEQFDCDGPL